MKEFDRDTASSLSKNISAATIAETSVDLVIDCLRFAMNPLRKPTETTSLLDVDRETDVVTAAQELFSSILAPRLLELRRQHNTLLPINSLPAETLAYIISISIHSQLWSVSTISCLASVCTRWWQIILTTPSLWATARLFEKPELAITMSKEAPLTIFVPHGHHLGEEMKEFIDITGPYIHRWQSVSIQTPFIDYVFAYLTYPLPGLKELHIGYVGSLGERRLVLGATPELRHLRLSRIAMAWEALADLSLETLSLSHLPIQGPSMQQLYQILASSPHLTKLTLVDLEDPIGAAGFQAEVLSLKRLCSVEIRHIGQHTLTGLAKVLQAQTLSSLILAETISPVINTSQLQKILRPSSEDSLLPSVIRNQALNRVYLKTSALGLRLSNKRSHASMSGACLDIDIQGMAGIVLLPAFGAPNRGYDVDLDVTECVFNGEERCRTLGLVDPLVLRVGSGSIPSVMEALSKVPVSSSEWFCPRLRDLHLVSSRFDSNMAATTLQVRNGPDETGALVGRSRLFVYDAGERLFHPMTMSFKPRLLSSNNASP